MSTKKKANPRASPSQPPPSYPVVLSGPAITMLHRIVVGHHLGGPSDVREEIEATLGSVVRVVLKHRAPQIAGETVDDGQETQEGGRAPIGCPDPGSVPSPRGARVD